MKYISAPLLAGMLLAVFLSGHAFAGQAATDAAARPYANEKQAFLVSANAPDGALWNKYSNKAEPQQKTAAPVQPEQKNAAPLQPEKKSDAPAPEAAKEPEQAQAQTAAPDVASNETAPTLIPCDLDLYLDDTKKISQKLMPEFLAYLPESTETLLARLVFSIEVLDVKATCHEQEQTFVVQCRLPGGAAALQPITSGSISLREFLALLGPQTPTLAQQIGLSDLEARSAPTQTPGIQKLADVFVAADGDVLLVSNNSDTLQRAQQTRKQDAGTVPGGYQIWAKWVTPLVPGDTAQPLPTATSWVGFKAIAEGWKFDHGSDLDKRIPEAFAQTPALEAAATAVYGANAPYLALALSGKFLAAANALKGMGGDASMDPIIAMVVEFTKNIDALSLRLGESPCAYMDKPIPSVTLAFTGQNETLAAIATMVKEAAQTTWTDVAAPGWQTVSASQGNTFDLPLPLLMAQKDKSLVMGLMAADSLAQAHKPQDILQQVPQAQTLDIPRKFSSIGFVDLSTLWRKCGPMLAPGGIIRAMSDMESSLDAETLALTDQLLQQTPPLQALISWTNTPLGSEGGGYILVQQGPSTDFSKTFAKLLTKLQTSN